MGLTRIRAEQISDIDYKQAVRVIQRTNITLAGGAPSSVDDVNLSANDRILVTGQDVGAQNGIYRVQTLGTGANGTWVRTNDGNTDGEIEAGMIIMVTEGEVYKDTQWKLTTNNPIIIGTTPLTFVLNAVSVIGGENTQVQYNQGGVLAGSANLTFNGTSLAVGGNVTANYFLGDGSQLSGIITSVANINNGTSNVSIDTANANITVGVNGTANVVVISTGLLATDGNVSANYFLGNGSQLTGIDAGPVTTVGNTAPVSPAQGDIWINSDTGTQYIYFSSGGNSQWAEMEADQSFTSSGGDSYGNANVVAYGESGWSGNIIPAANVTYNLGSNANRWQDIWLANSTIYLGEASISADDGAIVLPANTTVGGAVVSAVPKVTGFTYPGDDTAADPAGGQTILVNGSNFESGCVVYLDNAVISPVVFVSSTQLSFTSPAKATGTYSVYVVNPDGSTALALPGIIYSGVPAWSTAAGSIGTPYETTSFATTLVATADSTVTYAAAPGNTLPANLSLNSSTGNLSGTVPVTNNDTTYTFSVRATDAEQQDTDRQFSVTYRTDVVTWNSPANASSYTWDINVANSVAMSATSAAGKSVSYSVQSGSLPSNVAIAGNLITGSANVGQANTEVVIRATAADTARYADRTLYFTIIAAQPWTVTSNATLIQDSGSKNLSGSYTGTYSSIFMDTTGLRLFVCNSNSPSIRQLPLSSAFDLSTIDQFGGTNKATTLGLTSVYWQSNGLKIFYTSRIGDFITSQTVNPAWSTNDTTSSNFDVSPRTAEINGMYFSDDGSKLFICGNDATKRVYRYDLGIAWSLASSVTYVSSYTVSGISQLYNIYFKPDGTRMFLTNQTTGGATQVQQYNLGTAWDITGATLVNTLNTSTSYGGAGQGGITFNPTGTEMILGRTSGEPYLYKFNTNA